MTPYATRIRCRGSLEILLLAAMVIVACLLLLGWMNAQDEVKKEGWRETIEVGEKVKDSVEGLQLQLEAQRKVERELSEKFRVWASEQAKAAEAMPSLDGRLSFAKTWVLEAEKQLQERRKSLRESEAVETRLQLASKDQATALSALATTKPAATQVSHPPVDLSQRWANLARAETRVREAKQIQTDAETSAQDLQRLEQEMGKEQSEAESRQRKREARASQADARYHEMLRKLAAVDEAMRNEIKRIEELQKFRSLMPQ